jgi:hypothetical protein
VIAPITHHVDTANGYLVGNTVMGSLLGQQRFCNSMELGASPLSSTTSNQSSISSQLFNFAGVPSTRYTVGRDSPAMRVI